MLFYLLFFNVLKQVSIYLTLLSLKMQIQSTSTHHQASGKLNKVLKTIKLKSALQPRTKWVEGVNNLFSIKFSIFELP